MAMKYIIAQPATYDRKLELYLESHCQAPIFKADKASAKRFDTEQQAKDCLKFWKRDISSLASIQPVES